MYTEVEKGQDGAGEGGGGSKVFRYFTTTALSVLVVLCSVLLFTSLNNTDNSSNGTSTDDELENLTFLKNRVQAYYENGDFEGELYGLVGEWKEYFAALDTTGMVNPVVVFDIDETLLDNYPFIKIEDYGMYWPAWYGWLESLNATAVAPVAELYEYLDDLNIGRVLITGRKDFQANYTEDNLLLAGLDNWTGDVVYRVGDEYDMSATQYKSSEREKMVTDLGYDIIGCCGDQTSDCTGGYAGYIMKIPNVLYYTN
jgi:predicted secreted acid phosphatase